MAWLEQVGHFQAEIIDYGLKEFEGKETVAVPLLCRITAAWNPDNETWEDWTQFEEQQVGGDVFVIKKDGNVNKPAFDSLVKHAGWDANFESIGNKTWKPTPVSISVQSEIYNDKKYYKIAFVNAFDSVPGGGGCKQLPSDKVKQLQNRFGPELRALRGSAQHTAKPPANGSGPKSPPKSAPAKAATPAPAYEEDSIPFSWLIAFLVLSASVFSLVA